MSRRTQRKKMNILRQKIAVLRNEHLLEGGPNITLRQVVIAASANDTLHDVVMVYADAIRKKHTKEDAAYYAYRAVILLNDTQNAVFEWHFIDGNVTFKKREN